MPLGLVAVGGVGKLENPPSRWTVAPCQQVARCFGRIFFPMKKLDGAIAGELEGMPRFRQVAFCDAGSGERRSQQVISVAMPIACSKCQTQIPDDLVHCPACGADAPTDPGLSAPPDTGPEAETQPMMPSAGGTARAVLEQLAGSLGPNYQVRRVVGRGGFAEVYEVWDRNLERRLAAKVLSPQVVATHGALERFKQEARTVARLSHPAILPIHFVGDSNELAYYVMPFVEGESLASLIERRTKLPADEVVEIAKPVLEALAHAHEAGLIHRDIKPDNVMLEAKTNRALLVDFGIAKALDPDKASHMTQAGFTVGTPHFMSPEQALGDTLDARSDLYSFGAMMFEMVTGEKPFDGKTSQEVVTQHIADPVREPTDVDASIPLWISDIIVRCLEKKPADRFQSASDILQALAKHAGAAGAPAEAHGGVVVGDIIVGSGMSYDDDYGPPEPAPKKTTVPAPSPPSAQAPPTPPSTPTPVAKAQPDEQSLELTSKEPPEFSHGAKPKPELPQEEPKTPPEPSFDRASVTMAATAAAAAVAQERRLERAEKRSGAGSKVAVIVALLVILGAGGWAGGTAQGREWTRGMWTTLRGNVTALTSSGPTTFHQYVTNSLAVSVDLLVDGRVVATLGPRARDSLPLTGGTPPVISWRLIRPRARDGREMGQSFASVMSAGVQTEGEGNQHFAITGVARNRAMFSPLVSNGTNRPVVALINAGTASETRCSCLIQAGSRGTNIGYYRLLPNSTIRFYDARRAYRGAYREVRNFASRVDDLSGSVNVSVSN